MSVVFWEVKSILDESCLIVVVQHLVLINEFGLALHIHDPWENTLDEPVFHLEAPTQVEV